MADFDGFNDVVTAPMTVWQESAHDGLVNALGCLGTAYEALSAAEDYWRLDPSSVEPTAGYLSEVQADLNYASAAVSNALSVLLNPTT